MSFGCSVSDIAIVGKLAWKVYRACKDCPAVFQVIANEAFATHVVIKRLEEEAEDKQSMLSRCDAAKKKELMDIIGGLRMELEGLDKILVKYQQGKRIPNAFRMATMDLKIREGRRADPRYNISAWKGLELELAKNGISAKDVARYRPVITTFLLGSLSGKIASHHSLRRIALAVESRNPKAIRSRRPSREEGTSSEEETSSEETSSEEEPFSDKEASRNVKLFSHKEMSGDERSSSDEETSSNDDSFNPIAKNKKLSNLILHKGVKYATKALLEFFGYILKGFRHRA
ncbi:MAG: hypothetical protein Q9167_002175 [Letrouitia subvulpina]